MNHVPNRYATDFFNSLLKGGMIGPLGLAWMDGELFVADGGHLHAVTPGGDARIAARLFEEGWPGYLRGVAPLGAGWLAVTTASGAVARYNAAGKESDLLAEGLDQPHGVAVVASGVLAVAELGRGRLLLVRDSGIEVLAEDIDTPRGTAATQDGVYVADSGSGRVIRVAGGRTDTIVDGLTEPHGIAVHGGKVFILDAGAKSILCHDLATHTTTILAADLPIGHPPSVVPKLLKGMPPLAGPMRPFAGLAAGQDGTIFFSADGEGSVMRLSADRL